MKYSTDNKKYNSYTKIIRKYDMDLVQSNRLSIWTNKFVEVFNTQPRLEKPQHISNIIEKIKESLDKEINLFE